MVYNENLNTFHYTVLPRHAAALLIAMILIAIVIALFIIKLVRKKNYEAIMEREHETVELNEILLSSSPFIMNIWDENFNLIRTSHQAVEMFGLDSEQQYLERFSELSPEFQPCGTASIEKAIGFVKEAFVGGYVKFEWLHQSLNGDPIPAEVTLVRFMQHGKPFVSAYTVDLRPVNAAMQKVREVELRAKLMLDASPIASFLLDENRQAIDCNQAAIDLFVKEVGKPLAEIFPDIEMPAPCHKTCVNCLNYGKFTCAAREFLINNYRKTFPNYEENKETIERSMKKCCDSTLISGTKRFEFPCMTLYGETFTGEVSITPVKFQEETGFAVYIRDLSETQKMHAEMRKREIAEEESRAKTRFLARMSHEIRTPMSTVLSASEIQLQKGGHPPETEEAFSRIHNASSLLLTIINDILDLSKVETGKMEISPEEYETVNLISDTVQLNLIHIGSKRINFYLNVDENLPASLIGDTLRIKQILSNLISNAFKYTDEGMVHLYFAAEYISGSKDMVLLINLTDTGQGMDKMQVDALFDEFTRFNMDSNRTIEGTGLGMSITYSLIQMMQGTIEVESTPGKGSSFTVRIPQKINDKLVIGSEMAKNMQSLDFTKKSLKKVSKRESPVMPYGRVLVVDDVESNLYVVKGILSPYELSVDTVESGFDAIAKIEAGEVYDIIFMDHMMPDMDGIEATKIIRNKGYTGPVVALTANALKSAPDLFMNSGFDGFVSKPIDVGQLEKYLFRFIHQKYEPSIEENIKIDDLSPALVRSFLRDANKSIEILEPLLLLPALDEASWKAYTTQVHAIKSALANIGSRELSKMAYDLEESSRQRDEKAVKNATPHLLSQLNEIITEIKKADDKGNNNIEEDLAFLLSSLQTIEKACATFDKKTARDTLAILEQKPGKEKTKSLIDELYKYLLHSDFKEAEALAKKEADAIEKGSY